MTNLVGQQLGNYKLIQHLGQGGFADVYLGEHIHIGIKAAIKVLNTQLRGNDIEQFRNEARFNARLKHPNIVSLMDFDVENGTPFLVMEYAPNGSLRQHHPKDTCLPFDIVVRYVNQVASALQYAHDQRVIHRDVKPENMLVGSNNKVVLGDFGIAVLVHSTSPLKTQNDYGTALYMAPEQWDGKPRPASDQYALGITVYEWLNGKCPFQGNIPALLHQHKSVTPPPFDKSLQIPTSIEDVVRKTLSKDPEQRFSSVEAFALALEQASQPTLPPPIPQASYLNTILNIILFIFSFASLMLFIIDTFFLIYHSYLYNISLLFISGIIVITTLLIAIFRKRY